MTHGEKKKYKYISNLENDIYYARQIYLMYIYMATHVGTIKRMTNSPFGNWWKKKFPPIFLFPL